MGAFTIVHEMNCPYCRVMLNGLTGLRELQKFQRHLRRCRKNPANIMLTDGRRTVVVPCGRQDLGEALKIRYESGQ